MTELEVSDEARGQMDSLGYILEDQAEVDSWIRAIATPVVAAALRRMARDPGWCPLHGLYTFPNCEDGR